MNIQELIEILQDAEEAKSLLSEVWMELDEFNCVPISGKFNERLVQRITKYVESQK